METANREHIATLFANYDQFGLNGETAKAKVQGYLWAVEGKPPALVERVVKDFVSGKVDRPAARRGKMPNAEEFAARLSERAAGDGSRIVVDGKIYAPPFGPLWSAKLFTLLLAGPDADMQPPTSFIASQIALGGMTGERYRLDHQARNGFKAANAMLTGAGDAKGASVSESLACLIELFEAVPVGSSAFTGWRDLHRQLGWPWLPDMGKQRVVYFPIDGLRGLDAIKAHMGPSGRPACGAGASRNPTS